MGKKKVNQKGGKKHKKNQSKQKDTPEENKADFYLDDADADLAYNSSELEEEPEPSESQHGSELDFGEEDYIESEPESEKGEDKSKKEASITKPELKKLIKQSINGNKIALTKMIIIFNKITNPEVTFNLEEDEADPDKKNILANSKVISRIINFCIETLPGILELKLNEEKDKVSSNYKAMAKRYVGSVIRYIKVCEMEMRKYIFSKIDSFSNIVFLFANFTEVFLKIAIQTWKNNALNDTGKDCMSFIKSLVIKKPKFFEYALKVLYINYLDVAKAMNINSYEHIKKLQDDIIELLQIDLEKAYITIFTFIRKLCIQLRATIVDKTASSIKSIYNWQFVNSLILWGRAVVFYKKSEDISMLLYPLIQTIIGVIRLNYSELYYLLRLRLVMLLNYISKETKVFIPISMYVLPILFSNYFIEKCKENNLPKDTKLNQRINILTTLKIKKEEYKIKQIRKDLLEECCNCLVEFLSANNEKICFEDLAFTILKEMRGAMKNIYDKGYREIIKNGIEKIEDHVKYVKEKLLQEGEKVNLTNKSTIAEFEKQLKDNDMEKQFNIIQHKREATFEAIQHQKENTFIEV